MNDCRHYEETLQRLACDPGIPLLDELALHLDECTRCRKLFDASGVPLDSESFEELPRAARKKILQSLAKVRSPKIGQRVRTLAAIAALVVFGITTAILLYGGKSPPRDRPILSKIVQDHIRYLNHPDRQTGGDVSRLKPYVQAYVDFPFELPNLPESRLTGVRRCFLGDRRAVLAFYDTSAGPASYFIVPADKLRLPGRRCANDVRLFCAAIHGYRVVSWEEAGLLHALVGPDEAAILDMARACTEKTGSITNGKESS